MPETLEARKLRTFDPVLGRIIAGRVIHRYGVREYHKYEKLIDELMPTLRAYVNPALLEAIRNGLMPHDSPGGGKPLSSNDNYVPEDAVRSTIRDLVEYEHGKSDRPQARKITEACMQLVRRQTNSEDMKEAISLAISKLR